MLKENQQSKNLRVLKQQIRSQINNLKTFHSAINPAGEILSRCRQQTQLNTKPIFKKACALNQVIDPYHSETILTQLNLNEFQYNQAIESQPVHLDTEWFYYDQTHQFHPVDCHQAIAVLKTYCELLETLIPTRNEMIINAKS